MGRAEFSKKISIHPLSHMHELTLVTESIPNGRDQNCVSLGNHNDR